MNKLVLYLTKQMVFHKIIEENQVSIYQYGLEILIPSVITSFSVFICSILISSWYYGLLYLALTIPIRTHGGGYHASTRKACFILSNTVFILLVIFNQLLVKINLPVGCWFLILFASFLYIYSNTPIVNIKQPLSKSKLKRNERAIRLFASVDFILFSLLLTKFPSDMLLHFLILSYMSIAILILIEKLKLQFKIVVGKEI